ncbi:MAG: CARDB domain-containing protein, partial [Candidatus Woesearchaeota archaeon]
NYSIVETNLNTVWYHIDAGGSNTTLSGNTTFNTAEGQHTLFLYANDSAGHINVTNISFTVDLTDPVVNLNNPLNDAWYTTNSFWFNYTPTDTNLEACALYGNWSGGWHLNQTVYSPQSGLLNNFSKITLPDGIYHWNAWCNDSSGRSAFNATNFTLKVDITKPSLFLYRPENKTYSTNESLPLNYTAVDKFFSAAWYHIDAGGTNTSLTGNITFDVAKGTHTLFLYANDSAGNINVTSAVFTADIDNPEVNLNYPLNGTWHTSSAHYFNYTPVDDYLASCSLYGNWSGWHLNQTDFSPTSGAMNNFSKLTFTEGIYIWNVLCNDSSGKEEFNLTNYTFKVDPIAPRWSAAVSNPSSPTTYSPSQQYSFNATWSDTFLSSVWISHNFTGSWANYTLSSIGSEYYHNRGPMAVGGYAWRIYANDSAGNINATSLYPYSITKADSSILLKLNGSQDSITINESQSINLSGTMDVPPIGTMRLYNDGVQVNTGSSCISNVTQYSLPGTYPVRLEYDGNANYSSNTTSFDVTVNDILAPNITMISPLPDVEDEDGSLTFRFNVTDSSNDVSNCTIWIGGTKYTNATSSIISTTEINDIPVSGLTNGNYTWNVSCIDAANNRNTSVEYRNFTIKLAIYSPNIRPHQCNDGAGCDVTLINTTPSNYEVHGSMVKGVHVYVYVNFTPQNIKPGSNISSVNISWDKYQEESAGFFSLHWYNESAGWVPICLNDPFALTLPPSGHEIINCTFPAFPSRTEMNDGLQVRADWYYTGTSANKGYGTYLVQIDYGYREDTTEPSVTLISPEPNNESGEGSMLFEYQPFDVNLANCTLYGDFDGIWSANRTNTSVINNAKNNFSLYLEVGFYEWNVMCTDIAGNTAFASNNRTINITKPDLTVTPAGIVFSNSLPDENEIIVINATINNTGYSATEKTTIVQFFDGNPDDGGVQIGSNQTIGLMAGKSFVIVNVSWTAVIGNRQIYVLVDVNDSVDELYESNNNASNAINVPFWQEFYGNATTKFVLADGQNKTVIGWENKTAATGNIFVTDKDALISWLDLQALGRNKNNISTANDFAELDSLINSSSFADSVNLTYTSASVPKKTSNFVVYLRNITNVPIDNSTNNSNFITGILWDTSDDVGDIEFSYEDMEDIVFVTKVDESIQGKYGIYDYEVKIPVSLRKYKGADQSNVHLYYELL